MSGGLDEILREVTRHISYPWANLAEIEKKAKAAILAMVPDRCPGCAFQHEHPQICVGFNQAIDTILKRFEGEWK